MTDLVLYDQSNWYDEVPRRTTRIGTFGIIILLLFFGGFGTWAFRAPLAAAVISPGSFVATGQNKIIQHLEGGIIDALYVEEGDTVTAGQPLVALDQTAPQTKLMELSLRLDRLEALRARLTAEYEERRHIRFPPHLLARGDDPKIGEILETQRLAFEVSLDKLDNDLRLIEANIDALDLRIIGYEAQDAALASQLSLLQEDYENKEELAARKLIREAELASLSRALLEGIGQSQRLEAEVGESVALIEKYNRQLLQTRQAYRQVALDELQQVEAELDSIREQSLQARDVLARTEIAAPVSGTVVRLHYHTTGGVIEGGKPIMEILPEGAPLIIETLVPSNEIDRVLPGSEATVRLVALNQRTTPMLNGVVDYVSADAIPDKSMGELREVYVTRVSLAPEEIARASQFRPTPGMPAEILIKTEERTFFQYVTKPIADSMQRAFREE